MAKISKELQKLKELIREDYEETLIELTEKNLNIYIEVFSEIQEKASYISDIRNTGYVIHDLENILIIIILALLSNCDTYVQIAIFVEEHKNLIKKILKIKGELPSKSTIRAVVTLIEPTQLEKVCREIIYKFIIEKTPIYEDEELIIEDIKSMDGKTANASSRSNSKNGKVKKVNAMSLYSVKQDTCEATLFIPDKTNEIPSGPKLLEFINIENCIITFDALNTQIDTISYIKSRKAHYVAPVKGNQECLMEYIKLYFDDKELFNIAKQESYLVKTEIGHYGPEKREYIFSNNIKKFENIELWKGLKSIGVAKRTYTTKNGETQVDTRYYISDIDASKIELLSNAIRNEWGVENKLHYYLDMVFKEDNNKCFAENSQKNLNILRKFVLDILKIYKKESKLSLNAIRFKISINFEKELGLILKSLKNNLK